MQYFITRMKYSILMFRVTINISTELCKRLYFKKELLRVHDLVTKLILGPPYLYLMVALRLVFIR